MKRYQYYERDIHYYETDKMAIVHHSNYARILEECRIDMMRYYGLPYDELEALGYMIPVLELSGRFVESIRFGETIKVVPEIYKVSAFKFYIRYTIYDAEMKTVKHTAESTHCFLNQDFRPVSLKKEAPELFARLMRMAQPEREARDD